MDRWDLLIVLSAGYIAVMSLVRLMTARRNRLVNQLREQIAEQRNKKRKRPQAPAPKAEDAA